MKKTLIALAVFAVVCAHASEPLDPKTEYRFGGSVLRDAKGQIERDPVVLAAFKTRWACPSTGKHEGACPGWAIDHVIPLACGGVDAVLNLQWLPDQIKSTASPYSKDRFERRAYGGASMSKGCP